MTRESFLETIRRHYTDEIQDAYQHCEHGGGKVIDYPELDKRLGNLMANARLEGLPEADFESLVNATLPHIVERLDFYDRSRRAA